MLDCNKYFGVAGMKLNKASEASGPQQGERPQAEALNKARKRPQHLVASFPLLTNKFPTANLAEFQWFRLVINNICGYPHLYFVNFPLSIGIFGFFFRTFVALRLWT